MSWAVCLLNWNRREDTLRCLSALVPVAGDAMVIVADNGSQDGSLEAIRAAHPEVELIDNGANLGFSGGYNRAIRHAFARGASWVVLLNNDAILAPDALGAFRAAAERWPGAGVLAGRLFEPDGRVQWAGQRIGLLTGYSGRPRGFGRPDAPELRVEAPVERAVGALMAVSRAAVEAAGELDEDLFAYVEDVDWSLRIREAGFECVLVPGAAATHELAASSGGRLSTGPMYYGVRNTIVVCERHRPLGRVGTRLRRASILASFLARALLVVRSRAVARAVRSGYADARAGRLGPRRAADTLART